MVTVIGDGGVRNGFVFVPPTPFTVTSTPSYNIVNFLPGSLVVRGGGRFSHHLLGCAAKEDVIQACPPMGSHDDEMGRLLFCHLDNLNKRFPFFHDDLVILELLHFLDVMGLQLMIDLLLLKNF